MSSPDRNDARRKAGAEYFERVLLHSGHAAAQQPQAITSGQNALDPDLIAFGQALEGSKHYVLSGLYACTKALQLVTLKHALDAISAPFLTTALMISTCLMFIWLLHSQEVIILPTLTLGQTKSASVHVGIHGGQMMCVAVALQCSSVFAVLSVTCAISMVLEAWISFLITGSIAGALATSIFGRRSRSGTQEQQSMPAGIFKSGLHRTGSSNSSYVFLIASAVVGALGVCLLSLDLESAVCMTGVLGLWAIAEAARIAWDHIRYDPSTHLVQLGNARLALSLEDIAGGENLLSSSQLLLHRNLIPLLPAVLLAVMTFEGRDILAAEVSVPAASWVLMSCLTYVLSSCSKLFILDPGDAQAQLGFVAAPMFGAAVIEFVLHFTRHQLPGSDSSPRSVLVAGATFIVLLLRVFHLLLRVSTV